MRKMVKFERTVRLMNPIWHERDLKSSSTNKLKYSRPMIVLELEAGKEYSCDQIQALIDRGAVIPEEDYTYVCSHGFVPALSQSLVAPSPVSTGLDPKEDLN